MSPIRIPRSLAALFIMGLKSVAKRLQRWLAGMLVLILVSRYDPAEAGSGG